MGRAIGIVMKKILHKAVYAFAALVLSFFCAFTPILQVANAATSANVTDFSKTDILDDLSDVDILLYPQNKNGELQVIRCQEYCFSGKPFFAEYYGIFLYVYNPTETPLQEDGLNTINMAVAYNTDGTPKEYAKMPLTFCDRTDDYRFYKFQIADYSELLPMAQAYAEAHDGTRRYDFADIEFVSVDGKNVDGYKYSKTYYFNGYGAGCSDESKEESTLTCEVEGLETIELQIEHTNYRTEDYDENDICDELNTAYFSVPDRYFLNYGGLQKIKAEWYEYKTNPIFVTSDEDAYDYFLDYVGKDISDENLDWHAFWDYSSVSDFTFSYFKYGYANKDNGLNWKITNLYTCMDWLLLAENVETREDYYITAEEVEVYMETYTKEYGGSLLNGYSANLFSQTVDEGRLRGYNVQEIDAAEKGSLFFSQEQSLWNKMWNGLKFDKIEFSPIIAFSQEDLSALQNMSGAEFGEKYFINEKECESVRQYCLEQLQNDAHPVLFRFAVTDYYASTAYFDKAGLFMTNEDGFVAQMTTFHDFDVISLTFRNERGVDTVIAACADPIDIINGVTPPSDLNPNGNFDWVYFFSKVWEVVLQVVGAVVAVVVVVLFVKLLIAIGKKIFGDNDG